MVECRALDPAALILLQRLPQQLAQWIGSHSTSLGLNSQGLQRGVTLFQHGSITHVNCKPPKRSLHVFAQLLSCVQLFATPWTIACLTPLSMGFSRQEHEWVAMPSSRGSSRSRDQTGLLHCRRIIYQGSPTKDIKF